ncbi:hypothetical protein EDC04DRAFT_2042023 [Pisolithus marmoratus]|nr:hypothetical protein EDC04DRAFT_2902093 [Pisolithus marmoratus]KAI6038151.1 hypothetical protein EDC04DRAFT_2042023 [Pisolithus marmoratus]
MSPQFQLPTLTPTEAAASTVSFSQSNSSTPASSCLFPEEHIVNQEKILDDRPQCDSLLEEPWFSGYHAHIADNSYYDSVFQQDGMPSPSTGPANGADGNIPVTSPDRSWDLYFSYGVNAVVNPISLVGSTSTSDMQQPPPEFLSDVPQGPTSSQVSTDDRWPCGWRDKGRGTCDVLIGYYCEAHLASAHGIVNMSRTQPVECGRCGKRMERRSILRHYREKHLGFRR